ncbi:hypothetical protein D769_17102 [Cupriavidus sp. HMR-1]|nr:hypothetical protein D769_17102 [Cupriavidus sp. HMR-1]
MIEVLNDKQQFLTCHYAIAHQCGKAALKLTQSLIGSKSKYDGLIFLADDLYARNRVKGWYGLIPRAQPNLEKFPIIESAHIFCFGSLPRYAEALCQCGPVSPRVGRWTNTRMTPRMSFSQWCLAPQTQVFICHASHLRS